MLYVVGKSYQEDITKPRWDTVKSNNVSNSKWSNVICFVLSWDKEGMAKVFKGILFSLFSPHFKKKTIGHVLIIVSSHSHKECPHIVLSSFF